MYRLENISHNEIHMVAESRYVDLYDQGLVYVTSQENKWSQNWSIFLPDEILRHDHLNKESLAYISLI